MLESLQQIPLDPIFKLLGEYQADSNPQKVNLGIGLYATEDGQPYVFPSIKAAFVGVDKEDFNYQPIGGNRKYLELTAQLVLGEQCDWRQLALQATCGGTQACRLYADLVVKAGEKRKLLVGHPTWGNHYAVFAGLEIEKFDHLDENGEINVAAYKTVVEQAEPGSILMLHGARTHNPTGRNLDLAQTKELIPLLKAKKMAVYIDAAYLGFGDGMDEDCEYVRVLFTELDEVACGISYSKNASLYEHRTGALIVKTPEPEVVQSHLQQLSRESISMAPGIGQEMMIEILTSRRSEWLAEVEEARQSLEKRKRMLVEQLPGQFQKMLDCRGMFGFIPLTSEQILRLKDEFSVYILGNTRVNFAGIKVENIDYLVEAIAAVS